MWYLHVLYQQGPLQIFVQEAQRTPLRPRIPLDIQVRETQAQVLQLIALLLLIIIVLQIKRQGTKRILEQVVPLARMMMAQKPPIIS